jgi:death-on-curing protein
VGTLAPRFIALATVRAIHALQIGEFGGSDGIRDERLFESAVAQPMATFGGEYLHGDVFAMAAAYLFHLVKNHPFVDGNKRTGLAVCLVFLEANNVPASEGADALYELTMGVANGSIDKSAAERCLRQLFAGERR